MTLHASSVDLVTSSHLMATYTREIQLCPVLSISTMTDFDSTHTLITEVKADYRVLDHLDSIQTFCEALHSSRQTYNKSNTPQSNFLIYC